MRSNYIAHDRVYQHKRSAGEAGWDKPEDLARSVAEIELFLSGVSFPDRPSLLELGCGAGNMALHFARKGWTVSGVDISPCAIDWARDNAAADGIAATFYVGDLSEELVLPIRSADLVLDGHCLHCIIGDHRSMFLQNALTYLRPGGLLCIHTMCGDPVGPETQKHFDVQSRCVVHNDVAGRYLGLPAQILQEVRSAGFEIIKHAPLPAVDVADQDSLLVLAGCRGLRNAAEQPR